MRKHCISCGAPLWEKPLLTLDHMPASAQDIPDATQVKTDEGITLNLCQCTGCGLVQFDCEPVAYYRDVIRAGGYSTTMTELRRRQYRHLIETYHLEGKKFIEVGCGQGEFLQVLTEFAVQAKGLEHDARLVGLAREKGLDVEQGFAQDEKTQFPGGPYDVFLSFNFLEHQPDPRGMLAAIWENLAEDGMGLITVPSFEYIMENDGYYELIRDHIAYYTFDSLKSLLERSGFCVLEQEMINRDTLSFVVKKRARLDVGNLLYGRDTMRAELSAWLRELSERGGRAAIWGAGHQGFTLAATTQLGTRTEYIIDSAPFKQGRFAPASHLPIVPPQHFHTHPVEAIVIAAPGYTDEIAKSIREKFGDKVQIMAMRSNHLEELAPGERA